MTRYDEHAYTADPAPGGKPFVMDAVMHAFNRLDANCRNDIALSFRNTSYQLGIEAQGHEEKITKAEYVRDWNIEELAELVFVESDVAIGTFHGLPLWDWFHDGLCSNEKGVEMRARWPDRVLFYAAVDPLGGEGELEKARSYVEDSGAVGLKIYPERYFGPGNTVPVALNDDAVVPFLELAMELGVVVAIHKALPAFHGRVENHLLGDVEAAAEMFPDLPIEVVHSGLAFLDETMYLLNRYPNVWANLEVTTAYAPKYQRRFAEAMGKLLYSGAGDRIVFASGTTLTHPQPLIEALWDFQMPADLVDGYAYPQVDESVIRGVLGENYARLHDIDIADACAKLAGDEFSRRRGSLGARPQEWAVVKGASAGV